MLSQLARYLFPFSSFSFSIIYIDIIKVRKKKRKLRNSLCETPTLTRLASPSSPRPAGCQYLWLQPCSSQKDFFLEKCAQTNISSADRNAQAQWRCTGMSAGPDTIIHNASRSVSDTLCKCVCVWLTWTQSCSSSSSAPSQSVLIPLITHLMFFSFSPFAHESCSSVLSKTVVHAVHKVPVSSVSAQTANMHGDLETA